MVCALRVGEETVWSTHKHFSLPSPAEFVLGATAARLRQRGRCWNVCVCVCASICGVNGASASVRKKRGGGFRDNLSSVA